MLATFVIEVGLAIYTIWRYKMTTVSRLAVAILLSLGAFQLAEYMICGGLGWTHIEWARAGYVAITLLPALGIHMLVALAGKKRVVLTGAAYLTCAAFVGYYLINTASINGQACYPNYAVFNAPYISAQLFGAYYYGWLMVGTYLAWHWGMQKPKIRKQLHAMMLGYLVFLIPTTTVNIIDHNTVRGIPSIMCGFAVLLALIIAAKVLPLGAEVRSSAKSIWEKLQTRA